jgi:glycosyltransferase involved in cell wall biosynthesis
MVFFGTFPQCLRPLGGMGVRITTQRKVSVIVPTCDRPALLRGALASIRALEGPDLIFEILVGDNGVAPETPAIAEEFGAIYLKASTRGPSAARNVCLRAATGDYFAFLDDDDVWLPGHLRPHMALLDSHPALDAVIGQVVFTDQHLVPKGSPWPTDALGDGNQMLRRMLSGFFPQIGTTLARISVRERFGDFNETLIGAEDWDWFLRIARKRRLGFVATPCILFRGRASGSYDAVQRTRVSYTRRIFFRRGLPEWRIWRSPLEFSKAYTGTLTSYYQYFVDAAVERAESNKRSEALRAIASALSVFPLRGAYHLIGPRPLRKAFWASIAPQRRSSGRTTPRLPN